MLLEDVFSDCSVDGNSLYLPEIEVERSFFLEIKKRITLAGGKWQGGKKQCFTFDFPATEVLNALVKGEVLNFKQDNQFFETQEETIATMAMLADIQKGGKILEPSAGRFAIGRWLWEYCNTYDRQPIDCYELNRHNQLYLKNYPHANFIGDNFLLAQPEQLYDVILANPPFAGFADTIHIMHMADFLKPFGVIVSVMSTGWQTAKKNRRVDAFKEFLNSRSHEVFELPKDSFKASGTSVNACIIVIHGQDYF